MKTSLIERVSIFLLSKNYTVKNLKSCFDVLARKNGQILLIKVLEDANSVNPEYALDMKQVGSYIKASPLVVAEKAGNKLQDYVVYSRFGISTVNFITFKDCVDNKFPFVRSTQAGLTANLVGRRLKEEREQEGISLNNLAQKVGVSSRMIAKYESGDSEITVKKALRLYDLFGHSLFDKINVFELETGAIPESHGSSYVSQKYKELGFETLETKKFFDVVAKKEKEIILTEIGDRVNPELHTLSRLINADNLVIFKTKKPKNIPSLTKQEFMDFEGANELIKFLKEFG